MHMTITEQLAEALEAALKIADEARKEWDEAPTGMRAGKLLIALSGGLRGYRADIDAIHDTLAAYEASKTVAGPPVVDDVVKQVVIQFLVEITCLDCIKRIEAMSPRLEAVILKAFFRCADSRADQLRRERDEARAALADYKASNATPAPLL
jgi:hypothetical protein